jgi:hypothetical protein
VAARPPAIAAKKGRNNTLLVDRHGVPLVIPAMPANRSDHLEMLPAVTPFPAVGGKPGRPRAHPKKLYADAGFDCEWHRGPVKFPAGEEDPDGSAGLLQYLDGRAQTYRDWATKYYEREVPLAAVRSLYEHQPLDQRLVGELNSNVSLSQLDGDVDEIGYPSPSDGHGHTAAG